MEKVVATVAVVGVFLFSFALTPKEKATASNGKSLFGSTVISGNGKTCDDCHPKGKGLESAGLKTEWEAFGATFDTIGGAVNACVKGAMKGPSLAEDSLEISSLALYVGAFKKPLAAAVPDLRKGLFINISRRYPVCLQTCIDIAVRQ